MEKEEQEEEGEESSLKHELQRLDHSLLIKKIIKPLQCARWLFSHLR